MTSRGRLLLLLACLLLLMALGLYSLSQSGWVRQRVLTLSEAILTDALGREVRVEAVRLEPWVGRLTLTGIRVAASRSAAPQASVPPSGMRPGAAEGVLFSADRIRVRWSWTALLGRQLVLRQLSLTRPELALPAEAAPGLSPQDVLPILFQAQPMAAKGWLLRVRRASLRQGRLTWAGPDGTQGVLDGVEGELRWSLPGEGGVSTEAALRAARLLATGGEPRQRLDQIRLQVAGTADRLSVAVLEFSVAGASVTARGEVADLAGVPRLDLALGIQAPLRSLLLALGTDRPVEGTVAADGRLQGPWEQPVFRGEAALRLTNDQGSREPLRFAVRWEGGRFEAETLAGPGGPRGTLQARLALTPATGLYGVRARLADLDLAALAGLPSVVASQLGLTLPAGLRGRVSGEVNVTGRGADLAALRGQVNLRARDLSLQGEAPAGRLEARLTATASRVDVQTFSLHLPGGDVTGRGSLVLATGKLDLPIRADLRDVAAFGRGFGVPFLGGRATLQGRIAGARAAPGLSGRISWRDARIAGYPLDLIEGEVDVAGRVLRTPRLTVQVGRTSAILRGRLEAAGTAPLRRLNPKRDLVLDLQVRLNPARTADLQAFLPEDVEVQGAFRASGRLTGTLQALSGDLEVAFEQVRTWEESWQRGEAVFRLRPGAVQISRIALSRGSEQLTGEIGIGAGGGLRGLLVSTPMDLARVGSLRGSRVSGRAAFRLELQGTLRDTITRGQANVSALAYRDIALGPGTATFTVERKAVSLDLVFREGTHRLRLSVGPPSDRSVKGELVLANADLDLLARAGAVEALRPWQARGSGRILFGGPAGAEPFARGEADLGNLRLRLDGETWQSQGPVRASWNGGAVTVRQLRLGHGGRDFEVRGTLGEGSQTDLTVTGEVPLVLLAQYLPAVRPTEGLASANVRVRGGPGARRLDGTLEIRQGLLTLPGLPAEFRDVQASLALQGTRTEIRAWQARLAGGSFRAAGEIRRDGGRWGLGLTFQEEGGRAEQLLQGLHDGKGQVTGTLSLGGVLTSEGEEPADFWRNLGGDLKLSLRDGRIGRYTLMAKLLALLNMVQLLDLKGPELAAEGMPYQQLTADITIARGIARTEDLVLDSRAMKVNAVGQVNLVEDSVDGTVAVKPFQNVDRILSKIPVAGWLLTGKEESLLVAYYRVTGPLSDPRVTPIPLKSVGRNLFGIFRNLLQIPEALTGPFEELPPQPPKQDEGQRR